MPVLNFRLFPPLKTTTKTPIHYDVISVRNVCQIKLPLCYIMGSQNVNRAANKQTDHGMDCHAQLAATLFPLTILTRKVGHTDLDFDVRSGTISRNAKLQVSVQRLRFAP